MVRLASAPDTAHRGAPHTRTDCDKGIFKKRTISDLGEKKNDAPEGLWTKCPSCNESLFEQALAKNLRVCTHCGHHFTLDSGERIANICDEGSFQKMDTMLGEKITRAIETISGAPW